MTKIMKPSQRLGIATGPAPIKPENLTEEQKRDLLIKQAQQKLFAVTEGVIFNVCQNIPVDKITSANAQVLVEFASNVAEAYVKKAYGVTFHVEEKADPNEPAPAK